MVSRPNCRVLIPRLYQASLGKKKNQTAAYISLMGWLKISMLLCCCYVGIHLTINLTINLTIIAKIITLQHCHNSYKQRYRRLCLKSHHCNFAWNNEQCREIKEEQLSVGSLSGHNLFVSKPPPVNLVLKVWNTLSYLWKLTKEKPTSHLERAHICMM